MVNGNHSAHAERSNCFYTKNSKNVRDGTYIFKAVSSRKQYCIRNAAGVLHTFFLLRLRDNTDTNDGLAHLGFLFLDRQIG